VVGAAFVVRARAWWRERRTASERDAQLPEFIDGVVRSARVGMSLPVALHDGAEVVGAPILDDVVRLEREVALGVPLVDALHRWARAVASDDLDLFVTACDLGAEMGRGTADALEGVARTLSDRRDVAAEAHSAAAQARASAFLLAALPVAFTVVLAAVDPTSLTVLVGTPTGWACVAAAVALDSLGLWWMRRMIGAVS
jgi:tight adherence protein B